MWHQIGLVSWGLTILLMLLIRGWWRTMRSEHTSFLRAHMTVLALCFLALLGIWIGSCAPVPRATMPAAPFKAEGTVAVMFVYPDGQAGVALYQLERQALDGAWTAGNGQRYAERCERAGDTYVQLGEAPR